MKKDKTVWICLYGFEVKMDKDSKAWLWDLFPDGRKMITLKDSFGKQKLRLEDLYDKP